jgi:hypothetical protein
MRVKERGPGSPGIMADPESRAKRRSCTLFIVHRMHKYAYAAKNGCR